MKRLFFKIAISLFGNSFKIAVLRRRGATVGEEVNYLTQHLPSANESKMLTIGSYTTVSSDVHLIFHDGAIGPLINRNPAYIARQIHVYKRDSIHIGSHVFIGLSSIVLPGSSIGDFSVIAAGSVVSGDVPPGEIWGGVPAIFIKKTEDYIQNVLEMNKISK